MQPTMTRRGFIVRAGGVLAAAAVPTLLPGWAGMRGLPLGAWPAFGSAEGQGTEFLRLDTFDLSAWTLVGNQQPTAGTSVAFGDGDPGDVSGLYIPHPFAAEGTTVDLVATFQMTPLTSDGVDAGFQLAINDGPANRAAITACILVNNVPNLGLVGAGTRDLLTTYPAYAVVDWQAAPVTVRLRRWADGKAEIVEVNGQPPDPRLVLLQSQVGPRTRDGTTFEFGCFSGPATLSAEVSELYAERVAETVPFAGMRARADVFLGPQAADDRFDVEVLFTLGEENDGIDPLTEEVSLELGPDRWVIPAGSFRRRDGVFVFQGRVGSTRLGAAVVPLGQNRYGFAALGAGAELSGIANPVPVGLSIGNDAGRTEITARIRS